MIFRPDIWRPRRKFYFIQAFDRILSEGGLGYVPGLELVFMDHGECPGVQGDLILIFSVINIIDDNSRITPIT